MFKIDKDESRRDRFRLRYFMLEDLLNPLYTASNLTWDDIQKFIKTSIKDHNDVYWMHDLINLSGKIINLTEEGKWSVT